MQATSPDPSKQAPLRTALNPNEHGALPESISLYAYTVLITWLYSNPAPELRVGPKVQEIHAAGGEMLELVR